MANLEVQEEKQHDDFTPDSTKHEQLPAKTSQFRAEFPGGFSPDGLGTATSEYEDRRKSKTFC